MSTLSKMEERALTMVRPDPRRSFQPLEVRVTDHKTGDEKPMGFATQRAYALRIEVVSMYWANDAQRGDARRHAEAIITRLLYADVMPHLAMLRQAALQGDSEEAYRLACEIETTLRDKP
jgi:hypothetical protein